MTRFLKNTHSQQKNTLTPFTLLSHQFVRFGWHEKNKETNAIVIEECFGSKLSILTMLLCPFEPGGLLRPDFCKKCVLYNNTTIFSYFLSKLSVNI